MQPFYEKLTKEPEFKTSHEEIQFLKNELEQQSAQSQESIPAEQKREKLAESIINVYKEAPLETVVHESARIQESEIDAIKLRLSPEEHDNIIEDLFSLMMEKGIKNTLDVVSRMKNPHIKDDFHRFLVQFLASSYEIPGLRTRTDLSKSLGLRIYEVILPNKKNGEDRDFKQTIALMEQFMAGMQYIASDPKNTAKNFYTLELALPEGGDEMAMYVTVPKERADLFEKQLLGLFEDVHMTEVYDDYNIFSYSGVTSASYGTSTEHEVLQTKTYDVFDHDPMNVMVNAFSKLQKSGEGAAIQFIIMPHGDKYIKEYGEVLDNLKKGQTIEEATGNFAIGTELSKGFGEFFKRTKTQEEKHDDKKIDDEAVESVSQKLNSTIVQTNVRIITSSSTKQRADEVLHILESTFQQFNNTKGNGISFIRASGNQLEELTHNFIFRMFNDRNVFRLNLRELATMYHFPLEISTVSQLKQESSKIAPAPPGTPTEGIVLGKNIFRHKETMAHFAPEDRLRHFYSIGQTGTGKSHMFKQMIIQDIKNGDGVCFIDPHGTDIEDILHYIPPERIDDVIYFDPAYTERPMGLNMLDYDPRYPEQKSFVINELMSIFNKLFDLKSGGGGPMFEQYFRNSAGLVMEHPESGNTLLEIGQVLANKSFRDMKLRYCTNPIIKQFWANAEKTTGEQGLENFVPYITSKFDPFISNEIMRPVISQQKSVFNFREIMDNKKILLVNLSKGRLGEINANLIGLVLVGKILMAALSRVDALDTDLAPFYLYIDEFQNISTDSISSILSEARKYGLGLHITHQYIAQLEENIKNAVFGNVGSMATFRISSEDAAYVEKRFGPTFMQDDITKLPNFHAYLQMIGHGKPLTPFNIMTLPLEQFAKKNPPGVAEKIKQLSYLRYGKPRAEVEADIMRRYV